MALLDVNPLEGVAKIAESAKGILSMIFPDKTEMEKSQLAASMAMIMAQTDINKIEAQSTDPLQHWRGGLGWVCTLAYFNNFLLHPYVYHWWKDVPVIDIAPLSVLTMAMLGLTAAHVVQNK